MSVIDEVDCCIFIYQQSNTSFGNNTKQSIMQYTIVKTIIPSQSEVEQTVIFQRQSTQNPNQVLNTVSLPVQRVYDRAYAFGSFHQVAQETHHPLERFLFFAFPLVTDSCHQFSHYQQVDDDARCEK